MSDSFDITRLTAGLGRGYEITHIDKKPYPCCRTTHHAIDAALRLREEQGVRPEDIASILVETYDVGVLQCGFEKYPESPVEAKFSIKFTCAAAFVRGRVSLGEFCREMLDNPLVRRIAGATNVVSDPLFTRRYPKRWGSRMTLTLTDGQTLTCQLSYTPIFLQCSKNFDVFLSSPLIIIVFGCGICDSAWLTSVTIPPSSHFVR